MALLRFKQTYLRSGFVLDDAELPDHLCVVLEYAATVDQRRGRHPDASEWPLGTDARLCQAESLLMLGRYKEALELLSQEKAVIVAAGDVHRLQRLRSLERGERFSIGDGSLDGAVQSHLRLADRASRAANSRDALEHYRAARILLEVAPD